MSLADRRPLSRRDAARVHGGTMGALLVYDPRMAQYRFAPPHPLLPERFTLAVELMRGWGLLGEGEEQARVVVPQPATRQDILLVHTPQYVAVVQDEHASASVGDAYGLGYGDTPRFPKMHEAAALIAGGTARALELVVSGRCVRAFNPAGGLHHAHADRAAGFCVYDDCAIAIARATARHTELRVAYVDIDAHHGDGVEEAFVDRADVLTVSVHESGRYLYPGTGASRDVGQGPGRGYAVNVPMPPLAGSTEYELAFDRVIEPVLRAFRPDVIVAQLGADALAADPLAHLRLTVKGHFALARRLVTLADDLCAGRIVATGGGGYDACSATPRAWACAMAALLGRQPPSELPGEWLASSAGCAKDHGVPPTRTRRTFDEGSDMQSEVPSEEILRLAEHAIEETRAAAPLLGRAPH